MRAIYDLKKHIRGLGHPKYPLCAGVSHFTQPTEANHSIESVVESMLPEKTKCCELVLEAQRTVVLSLASPPCVTRLHRAVARAGEEGCLLYMDY